jgi:DNA-binding transcriptional MerR regulator
MGGEQSLFDHLDAPAVPPPSGKQAGKRETKAKAGSAKGDGAKDAQAKAKAAPKTVAEVKLPVRQRGTVVKASEAYRTISEVAGDLEVPQHVLRFWESKFSQIRPLKRGGGRRYYRPDDVKLIRAIRSFLHHQGYTIKGVQRLLRSMPLAEVVAVAETAAPAPVLRINGGAEKESGAMPVTAANGGSEEAVDAQRALQQALDEARAVQRLLGQLLARK